MRRPLQVALFVLGAAVFVYLVARIGIGQLVADAGRTGFMFVPIVLLYGLVYACSALAWQLTMEEFKRPPFWRTYVILVAAGALNFLTPLVNAGGEPFRAAAVSPWLGKRRAAGSVILHRMLHSLSYVLVWFTAVVLAFALLPRDTPAGVLVVLGIVMVVLLLIIAMFVSAHRSGILERILDWMNKIPGIRRLGSRLEPRRAMLIALDQQITDFYHRQPARFVRAIVLEYVSRCIFMLEIVLIVSSLGFHIGYLRAFTIGGLEAMAGNLLFLVPFEIGAREGAYYVLFNLFGLDPQLGLYASIVGRVRDPRRSRRLGPPRNVPRGPARSVRAIHAGPVASTRTTRRHSAARTTLRGEVGPTSG